jgi:hypothetical protein
MQVPHFASMQQEMGFSGCDFQLYAFDSDGRAWRLAVRMVVQVIPCSVGAA